MYRIIVISLLLAATPATLADSRHFEIVEHAAEVMNLEISADLQQLVYARRCDECQTLALSVDKNTLIYDGRRLTTISRAAGFTQRGGTIFFDPQSRRISRIVYWPKAEKES